MAMMILPNMILSCHDSVFFHLVAALPRCGASELRERDLRVGEVYGSRECIIGRRMNKHLPAPQAGAMRLPVRAAQNA